MDVEAGSGAGDRVGVEVVGGAFPGAVAFGADLLGDLAHVVPIPRWGFVGSVGAAQEAGADVVGDDAVLVHGAAFGGDRFDVFVAPAGAFGRDLGGSEGFAVEYGKRSRRRSQPFHSASRHPITCCSRLGVGSFATSVARAGSADCSCAISKISRCGGRALRG